MANPIDAAIGALDRFHQWTKDTLLPGTNTSIHDGTPGLHQALMGAKEQLQSASSEWNKVTSAQQDFSAKYGFKVPPQGIDV